MNGRGRILATLAVGGWTGAALAHLRAARATDETERRRWAVRRSQFLLLSSVSMNSLVLYTAYRYAKRLGFGRET